MRGLSHRSSCQGSDLRSITGLVVPWGTVGKSGGYRWQFQFGSLEPVDPGRLLLDHSNSVRVGHLHRTWADAVGQWAIFVIRRGSDGDRALAQAADGTRAGLSINVDEPIDASDIGLVRHVTAARWVETSLLRNPAFAGAHVTNVCWE